MPASSGKLADDVSPWDGQVYARVAAGTAAWNAPLVLGMRSIAIPLAVGNTVVMKPSEDAPITCGLLLADVLTEAGLPAGVLNVVTNDLADAGDVVAALKVPLDVPGPATEPAAPEISGLSQ